ncbi:MAG: hypothetical protein VKJ24_04205 [Synechococcales bacterium]|nr:hypothetical protein [Synechococcales bacterium]
MLKTHTTEELIQILKDEQRACMNGERLHLSNPVAGISPFLDRFIEPVGFQKFAAYDNFRKTIHQYQRDHEVSGLLWQHLILRQQAACFPHPHEQLITLPSDLIILQSAKAEVLHFWQRVTEGMTFFLSLQGGKQFQAATPADVQRLGNRCEWAIVSSQGRDAHLEVILQFGWGKPEEAQYRRGFPESGSDFIHAVFSGHTPIG